MSGLKITPKTTPLTTTTTSSSVSSSSIKSVESPKVKSKSTSSLSEPSSTGITKLSKSQSTVRSFDDFKKLLNQQKTDVLKKMSTTPHDKEDPQDPLMKELATAKKNIERAPVLYEHYRLGNDIAGPRMLHRRGQNETENYRTLATLLHSIEMTWEGEGDPTDSLPNLYALDKGLSAENYLHTTGKIYDPVGVEHTFKGKFEGKGGHDMQSNFSWLMGAMHRGEKFELVGPVTEKSLERGSQKGEASALLREIRALVKAGYEVSETKTSGDNTIIVLAPGKDFDPSKVTMLTLGQSAPISLPDENEKQDLEKMGLLDRKFDSKEQNLEMGKKMEELETLSKKRENMKKKFNHENGENLDKIKSWQSTTQIKGDTPLGMKST